jgi:formylglycine-generating enzyme required for sulfatase activity
MDLSGSACVDRFEAPNRSGERPILMVSATEAEAWCGERGKRLCREREWRRACGGHGGRRYPYGDKHEPEACHDSAPYRAPRWSLLARWPDEAARAEAARLDQSEPAGARAGCVSADGARDMVANVAEWVVRTEDHPNRFAHVVMGCSWVGCYRPPHTPSCDYVNYNHPSGWRSYEIGFRCCQDPAPAP